MTEASPDPIDDFNTPAIGLHWYHWLVIFLSLLLTFGAFFITEQQVQLKSAEQFDFQTYQILDLVEESMIRYEEALWAGVAALQMFPDTADRNDWKTFADSLDIDQRFPGINGIGVIHYVPPEKLSTYLAWQREDMGDYEIHPEHLESEYWPITYIEPQSSNLKAVGLDMAHERNRFSAAKLARDSSQAAITGPIVLVQDAQQTPGFLFYVPWYSQDSQKVYGSSSSDFNGLVYAPFIMYRLMEGALANVNRLVNFSIHDGQQQLYSELTPGSDNVDPDPLFNSEVTLDMYGRPWRFNLQSTLLFRDQQNHTQPLIILFGGLTIDALLLLIFMILAKSNRSAVKYAEQVTVRLKARKETLEDVSQRLEVRNRELEEANSELDQFAFVASHDLKAPLRGINQLARWIEEDSVDELSATTRDYLELMKSRISRLERLLDDLLQYSRVGRNEGKQERVSIRAMIEDVFTLLNHDGRFDLIVDASDDEVTTMTAPLDQVLRNLVANAMKHHHKEKGTISIRVTMTQHQLNFSVTDDGPGIPVEHQEKVFDLFHTLRPRDQVEGSGLGLSIIKKILDRHGSHYAIQSDGISGLTFLFTWPINDSSLMD